MKAVFHVANRLRQGAPIPRDFLPIQGLEHLGLILDQKVIDDPAEFNATLARVRDSRFPNRGAIIEPHMLTAEDEAKLEAAAAAATAPAWTPPDEGTEYEVVIDPEPPAESPEVSNDTPTDPAPPESPAVDPIPESPFRMVENDIFEGDNRIAGIYDNGLRMARGYADRRDELEAWFNTQPAK